MSDSFARFPWTDDMDEISGFGGSYEEGCRRMVSAGVAWLDENPALKHAVMFEEYKNVVGIAIPRGEPAKELEDAMLGAPIYVDGKLTTCGEYGVTGAMMQYSVHHAIHAEKLGWPAYQEWMREKAKREKEDAK